MHCFSEDSLVIAQMRGGSAWVPVFILALAWELFSKDVIGVLLLLLYFLDHVFICRNMLQIT